MTETRRLPSLNRPLLLRILGVLALVAALLWAAWISRELSEPRQQIVTVRLAETIAGFVDAEARGAQDPEASQARVLAFLQASERAVAEMGTDGRVVLVSVSGSNWPRASSIAWSATAASLNSSFAVRSIVSQLPSMQ